MYLAPLVDTTFSRFSASGHKSQTIRFRLSQQYILFAWLGVVRITKRGTGKIEIGSLGNVVLQHGFIELQFRQCLTATSCGHYDNRRVRHEGGGCCMIRNIPYRTFVEKSTDNSSRTPFRQRSHSRQQVGWFCVSSDRPQRASQQQLQFIPSRHRLGDVSRRRSFGDGWPLG